MLAATPKAADLAWRALNLIATTPRYIQLILQIGGSYAWDVTCVAMEDRATPPEFLILVTLHSAFHTTLLALWNLSLPPHWRRPSSLFAYPQPKWQKRKRIGSGSFGQVYLGFDRESGQSCAIKEIEVLDSLEQREQLNREIDLLRQLSHPNIVQYYGSNLTGNVLSIYMEYVPENSIHRLLMKDGPLEESTIRNYTKQVLLGLACLHRENIVHRDIKGANILVGCNGEIKLADFGMAKLISSVAAIHSACKGTPYWMAPEVIVSVRSGDGYNLLVDIWSLGCTVIEMATGKHPWHERCTPGQPCNPPETSIYITGSTKGTPEIPEHLSEEGKDFLRQCLQRDPRDRCPASELMSHPFIKTFLLCDPYMETNTKSIGEQRFHRLLGVDLP